MIAPVLPELVYGDRILCDAVRAALGDDTLPGLHEKRLDKAFAGCDCRVFFQNAPDGSDAAMQWGWQGDPDEKILPVSDRK